MPKTMALLAVLALVGGTAARAEQATAVEDDEATTSSSSAEEPAAPRRMIRVLQHPYDLASFYRSRPDGWRSTRGVPTDPAYALASFYRSDSSGPGMMPWAPFWAGGYAARPTGYLGYRHSIGENGELFLAVPFLAPVGPLSGAFFGY